MNKSTNETGASMVEILGVLAVVATIAIGMFTGISRMNQKIKLTQAQTEVMDIVKAMRTQFSSFAPSSITSQELYDIGILKNIDENGQSVNVYGEQIEVKFTTYEDNRTFQVWYWNVPPNVCTDLLMADWGNDPSSGLRTIFVAPNGPNYKAFYWKKDYPECETNSYMHCLPPSFKDVVEECSRSNSGVMTWEYYL